ncbi:DUF3667 domain-containing protein [Pedobacter sp. SL55]|uniref:DUF3667 domain-containing protein n=1 Tax=Pedobacter sp. SL55 TaxID=2995161 RepID=UPI0022720733|nr:DUF3667 domain-containing protein [Pedobacter sp. SL55]WAC40401.1 DUF3667 domain-containing protein [Pedobacter sp. SL55]
MSELTNSKIEQPCLNCDYTIDENFCRHCGQKRFKRIDKKYVIDEIQYLLIHTNKGFLYTIKKLVKNPGKTAREFIDGNRVNHYKPLLLMFVLSGISAFVSYKIVGLNKIAEEFYTKQEVNSQFMNDVSSFTASYNSLLMLLLVPIFAFCSWLSFKKWGNNYYEHVVMNSYVLSLQNIIAIIVVSPILFAFRHHPDDFVVALSFSPLITSIILIWFFKDFYPNKPFKSVLLRVLGTLALVVAIYIILMILITIAGVVYAMIKGPEQLKYFLPPNKI